MESTRPRRHLHEWAGHLVLWPLTRDRSPPHSQQRWVAPVGAAVLALIPALVISPPLVPIAIIGGLAWPARCRARQRRNRSAAIERFLPEMVDLLSLAVGSGCNPLLAIRAVAARSDGPLSSELAIVLGEVQRGRRLADALDDLPARAGESLRPVVAALVASERYGTPLLDALVRVASDVRATRRQREEARARQAPVKLLFPLITCTLPAFALLTVAPLIANGVRALRL